MRLQLPITMPCFSTFSFFTGEPSCQPLVTPDPFTGRQESSGDLDLATFSRLEAVAGRMARQAARCFTRAESVAVEEAAAEDGETYDDRWLHHYMLGKIASKEERPVQRVLAHYQKVGTAADGML